MIEMNKKNKKNYNQLQAACNTWKCVCYSVTREIWKSHKKSGKSQEALTWLVLQNGSVYQLELPKIINELLLIKFDIIYVRYRSEEISPQDQVYKYLFVCVIRRSVDLKIAM